MTDSSSIDIKHLEGFIPFDYLTTACIQDLASQFRPHELDKGKILEIDDKKKLIKKFAKSQITIELEKPLRSIPNNIKKYNHRIDGKSILFFEDKVKVNEILKAVEKNKMKIADISIQSSSLEEIFIDMVKKNG